MQLGLFDNLQPSEQQTVVFSIDAEDAEFVPSFVSKAQLELTKSHPLAFMFKGKTLEEIDQIDKNHVKVQFRKSNAQGDNSYINQWHSLVSAFQTLVCEQEYLKTDKRFTQITTGSFSIIKENGQVSEIHFSYNPNFFDRTGTSTVFPAHHIEFRSDAPSPISETGYRSHFIRIIPFHCVESFEDFLIQLLRIQFKITNTIVLKDKSYEFIAEDYPILTVKKSVTPTKCPECETKGYTESNGCDECGYLAE